MRQPYFPVIEEISEMLDSINGVLINQFEASLSMLNQCIGSCPEETWNDRLVNLKFCQVAFHVLFYTDYYLETSPDRFRMQAFHVNHSHVFRDYEELEYRPPVLTYEKDFALRYLHHCREKATDVIQRESTDSLNAPCGFERKAFSRAELHLNNIRHIQYHAAQLIFKLRTEDQDEIAWVGSGWQ